MANTLELWSDVSPLPTIETGRADLYLRFPAKSSLQRARDGLRNAGYDVRLAPEALAFCVPDIEPLPALRRLLTLLTPPETEETYALLRPCGAAVQPVEALQAMNVAGLRDRVAAGWLIELLRSQNLNSIFQPIVRSDDRTSVYGYEALARGYRDGEEIGPTRLIEVARNAHVMGQFDALATVTALTEAARSKLPGMLFINCSPSHIYDPPSRMAEVSAYCARLGLQQAQLVFEIVETERQDRTHLKNFIRACRLQHFRVALDDLGAGYSSLTALADLRPDLVKIDRELVTAITTDAFRALIVNRLLDASRILGVPTIVEGVETEAEFAWACANGATYVQGNLIGKPTAGGVRT